MWARGAELCLISPEIEALYSIFEAAWDAGKGPCALPSKDIATGPSSAGILPAKGPTSKTLRGAEDGEDSRATVAHVAPRAPTAGSR